MRLDLAAAHVASGEALGVEPDIELRCQRLLQTPRELSAVVVGIRDEDARWLRRWHGATGHYQSRSWQRQLTVYDVGLRPLYEGLARPLESHPKDSTSVSSADRLKVRLEDSMGSDPDPNCSQPLRGR